MMKIVDNLPKRNNRSHYTLDRRPKKSYKEKQAVIECYKLNSSPYTIHQLVAYRCVECGKFHIGHSNTVLTDEKRQEYRKKYLLNK